MRELRFLQQIYGNFAKKDCIQRAKNRQAIEMPRSLEVNVVKDEVSVESTEVIGG